MSHSSILVLGSVNVDLVAHGERLPAPGETVIGAEFFQAAGGKGANQAVAAARLSCDEVTLIAAVGDDAFGKQSLLGFQQENLLMDYVKVVRGAATGVEGLERLGVLADPRGRSARGRRARGRQSRAAPFGRLPM